MIQKELKKKETRARMTELEKKRFSRVPALDRVEYVRENGLSDARSRKDADLFNKNKDAFNKQVGGTITQNLKEAADRGTGVRNYNQESAAARTKARMEKEEKLKKQRDLQRYINRLKKW